MDASTSTRRVIERYVEVYRTGDTSRLDEIIAPDFVDRTFPSFGGGPEGVARAVRTLHAGLTEVACSIDEIVCEGDAAAFRVVLGGTHTGVFGGRPPTGRRVSLTGADFVRLRDGRFVELWSVQDTSLVLEALGQPASASRPAPIHDFPPFAKNPLNRITAASQFTDDVEGYVFDGADDSQVALWRSGSDRISSEHAHEFDEYVLVVEGRAVVIVGQQRTELEPGDECVIPRGTVQRMSVAAGTRTVHVFGGRRAKRAAQREG